MNKVFITLDELKLNELNLEVQSNEDNCYSISWQSGIKLRVLPSTDALIVNKINGIEKFGSGSVEIKVDIPSRVYFHIFDGDRKVTVITDRRVPIAEVRNFRDLGGYIGADGRAVRWGALYRSGELSKLNTAIPELWQSLDIGLILDFRAEDERMRKPTLFPIEQKTKIVSLEINAGNTTKIIKDLRDGVEPTTSIQSMMETFNSHFVSGQSSIFRDFFAQVASQEGKGVLFHCSAGKDRTGFAAALLLSALGVSHEQIMQDYLLTSRYFIPEQFYQTEFSERFIEQVALNSIRPLLEVNRNYLDAAFYTIRTEYGSIDNYLTQALGVTAAIRKSLQSHYLLD